MEETKKLCGAIPSLVIQIEASLDQINTIRSLVQALPDPSNEIASISQGISDLKIAASNQESRYDDSDRKEMLSWLSPLSLEARQQQLFEVHQRGTGEWLLHHETFQKWKSTRGSSLWCSGIPGAGKTIMASFVVNTLRLDAEAAPVAFVYADYKDHLQQSSVNLLSAITRQLAMQNPAIMEAAFSQYRKRLADNYSASSLTFAEYFGLLQHVSAKIDRIFVIVDAVDEIPETVENRDTNVRYELLHTLTQLDCVSLLCTSRPHVDASLYIPTFSTLTIEAKDEDVRNFLEETLSTSRRLKSIFSHDTSLKEEVVAKIIQKASGMFLMARLQAEEVKTALSVRQVRMLLGKLSGRLADVYKKTMDRISDQPGVEGKLGLRALSWVAYVKRPLTVSEFVHALSLETDDDTLDETSLIDIPIILGTCGGLL
ncbi:hypothetical protein K458DRAFT_323448, partial [Lentithecium fluviatile CBS 122367]